LRLAEQRIVAELRAVGVDVNSVWELVNTSTPYPRALPVLLRHLQMGGYPDRVMESLARALAVKPAASVWEIFRNLYLSRNGKGEMEGLAVALAASATPAHLEELVDLLHVQSRGDTRIHLLRAIRRVGARRGIEILESLKSDSVYGKEARALLGRRGGGKHPNSGSPTE
jgi:hypothetical protein